MKYEHMSNDRLWPSVFNPISETWHHKYIDHATPMPIAYSNNTKEVKFPSQTAWAFLQHSMLMHTAYCMHTFIFIQNLSIFLSTCFFLNIVMFLRFSGCLSFNLLTNCSLTSCNIPNYASSSISHKLSRYSKFPSLKLNLVPEWKNILNEQKDYWLHT